MNIKSTLAIVILATILIGLTYSLTASTVKSNMEFQNSLDIAYNNQKYNERISNLNNTIVSLKNELQAEKTKNEYETNVVIGLIEIVNKQADNTDKYNNIYKEVDWNPYTSYDLESYKKLYELSLENTQYLKDMNQYIKNNKDVLESKLTKKYVEDSIIFNEELILDSIKNQEILQDWIK